MFDNDFEMGEFIEAPPASESTEQLDTSQENSEDVNVANTQEELQGDISDSTKVAGAVPLDAFEAIRREKQELATMNERLLRLLEGTQTPKAKQPEPEEDELSKIDPDTILTAGEVLKILEKRDQQFQTKYFSDAQVKREESLIQYENTFRTTNVDYDETIKVLPPQVVQALYETYKDPQELVNKAYTMAKVLKGESAPSTTSTTLKQKVDVENKIAQNQNNPKSLSQAKGASPTISDAERIANKIWESL